MVGAEDPLQSQTITMSTEGRVLQNVASIFPLASVYRIYIPGFTGLNRSDLLKDAAPFISSGLTS